MNYQTRHQVYLRVLPVLFVSVLALGLCSWVLFENRILEAASEHQQQELTQLATRLRFQVGSLAMSAELHKWELRERLPVFPPSDKSAVRIIGEGIIGMDKVSATLQVNPATADLPELVIAPRLDTENNRKILDRWFLTKMAPWVLQNSRSKGTSTAGIWNPVILESDPWNETLLFPPIFLNRGSASETHLPMLVRQKSKTSQDRTQTLLLVSLEQILLSSSTPEWLCLVDAQGRILWDNDHSKGGFFSGMSGHDFLEVEHELSQSRFKHGLLGRWSDPWLVATIPSPVLPVTFFSARPAANLRNLVLRYMALVMGLASLSLLGALFGVMRVMKRVTKRLGDLADSMASLAKGEYSRRMPEGNWDEIGQLVGYFNLMAISLDEAHREVKEKTLRLRAALENMKLLDKAKDDFLVLISHEVRTPLTSIMGGIDLIKTVAGNSSDEEKQIFQRLNILEVISIIQSSGERLSGFMTDAIQMTAIQSSDRQLDLKSTPVMDLVEMGLCGIREKASLQGITVENQLEDQAWSILGDRKILKMALEKVFNNALIHNRIGGEILIREAEEVPGQGSPKDLLKPGNLRLLQDQPGYRQWEDEDIQWRLIEVFNSGEPIPEDRRKALFGKFELVGRIEHHHKGSGLSLPIAQSAVECHGGKILLHGDAKDGNSFYLLLPTILDSSADDNLWDDVDQGVRSAAGHKKMGQVADLAGLKIEVDDLGSGVDGRVHETCGGIDGAGGANDQEKVTVGSGGK